MLEVEHDLACRNELYELSEEPGVGDRCQPDGFPDNRRETVFDLFQRVDFLERDLVSFANVIGGGGFEQFVPGVSNRHRLVGQWDEKPLFLERLGHRLVRVSRVGVEPGLADRDDSDEFSGCGTATACEGSSD